jgi:thymidylate synthase
VKKEVSDALHFLLHCSLKDTRFTTQKEQFGIVYEEIERLHSIIKEVREYINEDKNCVPKHIKEYFKDLLDKVGETDDSKRDV